MESKNIETVEHHINVDFENFKLKIKNAKNSEVQLKDIYIDVIQQINLYTNSIVKYTKSLQNEILTLLKNCDTLDASDEDSDDMSCDDLIVDENDVFEEVKTSKKSKKSNTETNIEKKKTTKKTEDVEEQKQPVDDEVKVTKKKTTKKTEDVEEQKQPVDDEVKVTKKKTTKK
jgi:hypothetical protein